MLLNDSVNVPPVTVPPKVIVCTAPPARLGTRTILELSGPRAKSGMLTMAVEGVRHDKSGDVIVSADAIAVAIQKAAARVLETVTGAAERYGVGAGSQHAGEQAGGAGPRFDEGHGGIGRVDDRETLRTAPEEPTRVTSAAP